MTGVGVRDGAVRSDVYKLLFKDKEKNGGARQCSLGARFFGVSLFGWRGFRGYEIETSGDGGGLAHRDWLYARSAEHSRCVRAPAPAEENARQ